MTNSKSTKSALFTSSISLLLCFAMLLGTTFAWFTDNVATTNNIITAGNLDVELYYKNSETLSAWETVKSDTNVFKENTLWEPGHAEVVQLKVVNEGTLDLKYQLGINIAEETASKNVVGEDFKLSDYVKYAVIDGEQNYTTSAEAAAAAEAAQATALNVPYETESTLDNGSTKIVTLVVYMPTTVGNEANYLAGEAIPTIKLGINLYSTQLNSEEDSFGSDYDKDAKYKKPVPTVKVDTAAELAAVLSNLEEETVIDASGVVIDIAEQFYYVPSGATLKNATINTSARGGTYIVAEGGVGEIMVFENCTFTRYETGANIFASDAKGSSVVFNNCTFEGPVMPNCVDNAEATMQFNNCTFKITNNAMIKSGYTNCMGGTHTFTNCTFDYTGGSTMGSNQYVRWNAVNSYSEPGYSTEVILSGCTFTNCGTQRYGSNSTLTVK